MNKTQSVQSGGLEVPVQNACNIWFTLLFFILIIGKLYPAYWDWQQEIEDGFDDKNHFYESRSWQIEIGSCVVSVAALVWIMCMIKKKEVTFTSVDQKIYEFTFPFVFFLVVALAGFRIFDAIDSRKYSQQVASIINHDAPDCIFGIRIFESFLLLGMLFPAIRRQLQYLCACGSGPIEFGSTPSRIQSQRSAYSESNNAFPRNLSSALLGHTSG